MTLDFNTLSYDMVCLHAAQTPMFQGRCERFYSLAEHCVLFSLQVETAARALFDDFNDDRSLIAARAALLPHNDSALMLEYFGVDQVEEGVRWLLRSVATRLLVDEVRTLGVSPAYVRSDVKPLGVTLACMTWQHAAVAYSQRFAELWPDWDDEARAEIWRGEVRALVRGLEVP